MGFRINTNILSLNAQRNLSKTTKAFAKSLERLSSGSRINRAGDDAAGLAIGTGIESQLRSIARGIQNLNDAQGFLSTAEGAMAEQTNIVQRMRELALQAANGTIGNTERGFLDEEFQALLEEFNRITEQTDFNGTKLLDGTFEATSIQIGANKGESIDIKLESLEQNTVFDTSFETIAGNGTFSAPTTFDGTFLGQLIKTADFNNDGSLDLVATGLASVSREFGVMLGNGDGSFNALATVSEGNSVQYLDVADFNNDGNMDVIFFDSSNGTSIRLGNGDGTFANSATISNPSGSGTDASIGDIDGDGNMDVAITADDGAGTVRLLMGNGDGSFETSQLTTGVRSGTIELRDFDNDENLDILVASRVTQEFGVLLGSGDGSFASIQTTSSTIPIPMGANSADFNSDGNLDVIVYDTLNETSDVHLGNGDGSFLTATLGLALPDTNSAHDILFSDFNGDGNLDLIYGSLTSNDFSLLRLGNGDGSFGAQQSITMNTDTGDSIIGLVVGDFNNDGVDDIASPFGGSSTNEGLVVRLSNTDTITTRPALEVSTQTAAQDALGVIDAALEYINDQRAGIGALQSRLESAVQSSSITRENLAAARSQIFDADIAVETSELTRTQILQQAGVAVLGQANTSAQLALQLLDNIN